MSVLELSDWAVFFMSMIRNLLLACVCLLAYSAAMAQNAKKHEKFGLVWNLPDTWDTPKEKNSDTHFYAYPTKGGQAKVELRLLSVASDEDAAKATIEFMKEKNVSPALIKEGTPRKVKQGNLEMQIFEKDVLDLKMEKMDLYKSEKLILIATKGSKKRYILYMAEYYDKPAKCAEAFEALVKSLKAK